LIPLVYGLLASIFPSFFCLIVHFFFFRGVFFPLFDLFFPPSGDRRVVLSAEKLFFWWLSFLPFRETPPPRYFFFSFFLVPSLVLVFLKYTVKGRKRGSLFAIPLTPPLQGKFSLPPFFFLRPAGAFFFPGRLIDCVYKGPGFWSSVQFFFPLFFVGSPSFFLRLSFSGSSCFPPPRCRPGPGPPFWFFFSSAPPCRASLHSDLR